MASAPFASSSQHSLDKTHWGSNQPYRWQSPPPQGPPPGAALPVRLLPPIPVLPSNNQTSPMTQYRASSSSSAGYYDHSPYTPYSPPPMYYNPQRQSDQSYSYITPPTPPPKDRPHPPVSPPFAPNSPVASGSTPRGSSYSGADPPMTPEWSPTQLLNEPSRSYPALELEWDTIFDAQKHRVPVLPESWFRDGWELSGVSMEYILFIERGEKKRRVQICDIPKMSIRLLDAKYEAAVLSWDGKYLLIGYEKTLQIMTVKSQKTIKKFKAKNVHVRKWTSNNKGFCWVDTEGRFWRWSYEPKEDPEQLFKLVSTAPKYWMTPIAAHDGSWYAIVASGKDRRNGVVHAFPENHGEAKIFHGPASAAFTRVVSSGMMETALVMMTLVEEAKKGYVILDVQGLSGSRFQKQTRANITLSESMKLFPEVFIDELSSLAVTAISTNATDGSLALVFDPQGGKFVASRRLYMDNGDRIFCGTFGLHMERNASIFRRLKVHPNGPPNPDSIDAEEALFRSKSRRSSLSGQTDSGSAPATARSSRFGSHAPTSSYATSVSAHSGIPHPAKGKAKPKPAPTPTWGRGNFAPKDSDESWMFEKQRRARWEREDQRDDSD
ncbi:hypothetical protein FRB90_003266 [Tulasnella sp. 427]|nr:hypothetical protein FRB90_003266 [Tulasnella sp. 427]